VTSPGWDNAWWPSDLIQRNFGGRPAGVFSPNGTLSDSGYPSFGKMENHLPAHRMGLYPFRPAFAGQDIIISSSVACHDPDPHGYENVANAPALDSGKSVHAEVRGGGSSGQHGKQTNAVASSVNCRRIPVPTTTRAHAFDVEDNRARIWRHRERVREEYGRAKRGPA